MSDNNELNNNSNNNNNNENNTTSSSSANGSNGTQQRSQGSFNQQQLQQMMMLRNMMQQQPQQQQNLTGESSSTGTQENHGSVQGNANPQQLRMMMMQRMAQQQQQQQQQQGNSAASSNNTPSPSSFNPMMFGQQSQRTSNTTYNGKSITQAAKEGDLPMIVYFIDHKSVPPQSCVDQEGISILHWAAYKGHRDIVEFLLDHNMPVDMATYDMERQTPLMWAAFSGSISISKLLLDRGASVNAADGRGYTCVTHATQYGQTPLIHYLISKGGDPLVLDTEGHTTVHWAAYDNKITTLRYLVEECHVDVTKLDNIQRSALHWAARKGHTAICEYLTSRGCRLDERDADGKTPKEWAFEKEEFGSYELLKNLENSRTSSFSGRPMLHFQQLLDDRKRLQQLAVGALSPLVVLVVLTFAGIWLTIPFLVALVYGLRWVARTWQTKMGEKTSLSFVGFFIGGTLTGAFVAIFSAIPELNHPWLIYFLLIPSMAAAYYSYYHLLTDNPGYISPGDLPELREILQLAENGEDIPTDTYCTTCMIRKPLRSKHDSATNCCISRFDHYCVWVNTPVGSKNHIKFICFLLFHIIAQLIVLLSSLSVLYSALPNQSSVCSSPFFLLNNFPATVYGPVLFNIAALVAIVPLFIMQVVGISRNMTSNELMFPKRYPWIILDKNMRPYSLFDKGFIKNWAEFLGFSGIKHWDRVFESPSPSPKIVRIMQQSQHHHDTHSHHNHGNHNHTSAV